MATILGQQPEQGFVDRRQSREGGYNGPDRRQFSDGKKCSRPEVVELSDAIDQYKLRHRRRFVTFDEIYDIMISLGYHK